MAREFHAELQDVVAEFNAVAGLVAATLNDVAAAPGQVGPGQLSAVNSMVGEVQDRLRALEDRVHVLVALQAPVGSDLRRLVAILRLLANIERSSRHTRHVIDSCQAIDVDLLPDDIHSLLVELGTLSTAVFERGLKAWVDGDALAAVELDGPEQEVDTLQVRLLEAASHSDQVHGEIRLALGLTARHYERIADYGLALARDAAFVVTGQRLPAAPSSPGA